MLVVLICVCVSVCDVESVMKMGARIVMRAARTVMRAVRTVRTKNAAHEGIRGVFGFCVLSMFLAKQSAICGVVVVACLCCVLFVFFFNEL